YDPFAGINTTWTRVPGGDKIKELYDRMVRKYDFSNPASIVPDLMVLRSAIEDMPDHGFKSVKLQECAELIQACTVVYHEVRRRFHHLMLGHETSAEWELINRSSISVKVKSIDLFPQN